MKHRVFLSEWDGGDIPEYLFPIIVVIYNNNIEKAINDNVLFSLWT
jgi:hypothetical protein